MSVIYVDISNVWGQVALPDLLAIESEVADAHAALAEGTGAGSALRDWLEFPVREKTEEITRILEAAERIREDSEVCVVLGTGDGCLGARAAVELLQGPNRNMTRGKGDPQLLFAGNSLSSRSWNELLVQLKDRDFSVIVISGAENDLEPAVALRSLRWMLERKYGTDAANRRIYAVTETEQCALSAIAEDARWERFCVPAGVGQGFSVLTAAGLLPMAVAGIDILEVMNGAADARECYDLRSFENPVWQYAAVRNLLYRGGKALEIFQSFEPGFGSFGAWWQQLFAGAEGKDGKGLFPVPGELTRDLYTLGQMIGQGRRNLFETVVRFAPTGNPVTVGSEWKNLDGLQSLEGKSLDFVEEQIFQAAVSAHADSGVPVIIMDCEQMDSRKTGELFYFLELCCGISAYVLGVDPFARTGGESGSRQLLSLQENPVWTEE